MNKTLKAHHERIQERQLREVLAVITLSAGLGSVWVLFALAEIAMAMGAIK